CQSRRSMVHWTLSGSHISKGWVRSGHRGRAEVTTSRTAPKSGPHPRDLGSLNRLQRPNIDASRTFCSATPRVIFASFSKRRIDSSKLTIVSCGGEEFAVWGNGKDCLLAGVVRDARQFLAALQVPEADGSVPATRDQDGHRFSFTGFLELAVAHLSAGSE